VALFAQKHAVPFALHELMSQQPLLAQVPFAQQGWPVPPQATQVWLLLSHIRVEALHALPLAQHGWLTPPHVEQIPFEQARVVPEHVSPGQQTLPDVPQAWQVPETHFDPAGHCPPRAPPGQQGPPTVPHGWQVPLEQARPLPQRLPSQHG
jgi:hypothetical protein